MRRLRSLNWKRDHKSEGDAKKGAWYVINQPFTLWLLTSLALGFVTYTYSNYSTCRTLFIADRDRLSKIITEIKFRRRDINILFPKTFDAETDPTLLRSLVNRSKHYTFAEFKGVSTNELILQLENIDDRWNLQRELFQGTSVSIAPIDMLKEEASALQVLEYFAENFSKPKPKFPLLGSEAEYFATLVEKVESSPSMTPTYWKAGWRAPEVCLKRAFWPN